MENAILIMAQTYGVSILGYEGCPKHLGGIDSSNLLNNPLRLVLLSKSPFKRWQNHGPGRSSNLPEITQPAKAELILESRQPGSGIKAAWLRLSSEPRSNLPTGSETGPNYRRGQMLGQEGNEPRCFPQGTELPWAKPCTVGQQHNLQDPVRNENTGLLFKKQGKRAIKKIL